MADPDQQATVGEGGYEVQEGDCLLNIAQRSGHLWQTIWNFPANADLKTKRGDPNILLPGDHLTIPPIAIKQEPKPTEQRHKFVLHGAPAKLRIRVMIEDDDDTSSGAPSPGSQPSANTPKPEPKPRSNQPYTLDIDGKLYTGNTDGDGYIEVSIPPQASQGTLTVGPDNMTVKLVLGGLDPVDTLSGVQGRLNNLGFNAGPVTGKINNRTRAAIQMFQMQYALEATGDLDDITRQQLKSVHGS
jgi:hypothetical protein